MKYLWLRTRAILANHPILWLPVLWASALSYFWEQLRQIILIDFLPYFSRPNSVLDESVLDGSRTGGAVLYILAAINGNIWRYADICCYVIAFMLTARIVDRVTVITDEGGNLSQLSIPKHWAHILGFSFIVLVLSYAVGTMSFFLAIRVIRPHNLTGPYPTLAMDGLVLAAVAYFIAPMAVRLLKGLPKKALQPNNVFVARAIGLSAAAAIVALSSIYFLVTKPFSPNHAENVFLALLETVIAALPYTPLFIALSLLAKEDEDRPHNTSDSTGDCANAMQVSTVLSASGDQRRSQRIPEPLGFQLG